MKAQKKNTNKPAKDWYKRPWGIALLVLSVISLTFPIPLVIIMWQKNKLNMVARVTLTILVALIYIPAIAAISDDSSTQDNKTTGKSQQQTTDPAKVVDEVKHIADALRALVDKHAPVYCQNHTNFHMRNDQKLIDAGWPTFEGRRNWTQEECRTIVSKLLDITTEDRVRQISEGRKIGIGLSNVEVIYSIGYPDDINTTTTTAGTHEQWVYGDPLYGASYVYLDDGVVTSYQQ